MHLILNDLSAQFPVAGIYEARKVMQSFLKAYRAAKKAVGSDRLILDRDYNHILLTPEYFIEQWRNDHEVDIEDKRSFRSLIQQSDTYDSFPVEELSEFHAELYKCSSNGCLLAYLLSGCCLSFLCDKNWDIPVIQGRYCFLSEETGQDGSCAASVPNIASTATADVFSQTYGAQIRREQQAAFVSGKDILAHRDEFPNLVFCKNAEGQLMGERRRNSTGQIARRLMELQTYFESAAGAFDPRQLRHCTPETQATLEQYQLEHTFLLPDGKNVVFSWHLRFTGEYAGRIFFFPDMASKTCYIGHIGLKLPTVQFPT